MFHPTRGIAGNPSSTNDRESPQYDGRDNESRQWVKCEQDSANESLRTRQCESLIIEHRSHVMNFLFLPFFVLGGLIQVGGAAYAILGFENLNVPLLLGAVIVGGAIETIGFVILVTGRK